MTSGELPVVDIRGEPCGMPVVRVEQFLLGDSGGRAFSVLGDHEQTMDQLRLLAAKHRWSCEVAQEGSDWRAEFRPA
jgi:TusA-related sulfurtransferase